MKRLVPALTAILALTTAQAGDDDWRLRIRKEADGWSASFSGPMNYGSGKNRIKGSGVRVEKQRALGSFSKLRLDGPFDVTLSQAAVDQATVVADDNVEPLVETVVEGDSLVVRMKRDAGFTTRAAPRVRVDARTVQAIVVNGSGDVGFGLLELKDLTVGISGSGDLRLAGRAEQQHWSISGSGDVDARALAGRSARVAISGSGDVALGVTEQLEAQLSGSGDLSYAGRPQLRQSVSGSGEIHRR